MAFNKHLSDTNYKGAASAIVDNTVWHDADLAENAHRIATEYCGHTLNEAELGEIWTHVIGLSVEFAVLAGADVDRAFIALGAPVDYSDTKRENGESCCNEPCAGGQ